MREKNIIFAPLSNPAVRVLVTFYILLTFWWVSIWVRGIQDVTENYLFGTVFGLIPFLWGAHGVLLARRWGGYRSSMGRSVLLLSAGLFTWGTGQLIFSYYNVVLNVAVPYPSLADAAFIVSWPLWSFGMINLSRATGINFSLRRFQGKFILFVVPILISILTYYLLFVIARGGQIVTGEGFVQLFFDLAYPIGDLIILTLALLVYGLSFKYLGGRYKVGIVVLLLGFVLNFVADFSFSYTTTLETFFSANWVDFIFASTMFLLSFGVSSLDPKLLNDKLENGGIT